MKFKKGNIPWNRGLKISGMSGKTQSEHQKAILRERNLNDNPAKKPEVKEKMRMAKLGKKRKPHNEETKLKISQSNMGKHRLSGENHPNWIKDRSKLVKRQERNDSAYGDWRLQVYKRDNYKCKIDKDCSGRIIAHHILGWSAYPELRYEVNNGITLCQAHHPLKRAEEKRMVLVFKELLVNNV